METAEPNFAAKSQPGLRRPPIVVLLLSAATLAGFTVSIRSGNRLPALRTELARLDAMVGEMEIIDPGKIHLRRVRTDGPLKFAWHVYIPANAPMQISSRIGSGSGGSYSITLSEPRRFIAVCNLYEEDGQLSVYERFGGTSSGSNFGPPAAGNFLIAHQDDLQVEALDYDTTQLIAPGKTLTFLRVSLPTELKQRAMEELNEYDARFLTGPFCFRLQFGPEVDDEPTDSTLDNP